MALGERRAEGGHGILHTELMAGERIEVTFNDDEVAELPTRLLRPVQTEEHVAFAVERRLGRVQILGQRVVHHPAAECDHRS